MKIEFEVSEKSLPSAVVGLVVGALIFATAPLLGVALGGVTGYYLHKISKEDKPKDPPKEA